MKESASARMLSLSNRNHGLAWSPIFCTLSGETFSMPPSPTTRMAFASLGSCRAYKVSRRHAT